MSVLAIAAKSLKDLEDLYKRSRGEGFGQRGEKPIMVGAYALSAGYYDAYYAKAQKIRRLIQNDFLKAFAEVDVIMGPTAPTTAFPIGTKTNDPVACIWAISSPSPPTLPVCQA